LDYKINSYSCLVHKIKIDTVDPIIVCDDANIRLNLTASHVFVVPSNQRGTVTLLVTEKVQSNIQVYCAENVDVTIRLIVLFPETADITLSSMMCGDSSNVTILGMCALADRQSVKIQTTQIHCGKQGQSKIVLQGLINDNAIVKYDGTIRIEKDACGTYALQNNKNILLSSTAAAVSIPNIEVLNHDVQCFHGAAIGKFELQQMHYMQSRGLSELIIKQLLVQELFAQVLQGYEEKEFVLQKVYEKI